MSDSDVDLDDVERDSVPVAMGYQVSLLGVVGQRWALAVRRDRRGRSCSPSGDAVVRSVRRRRGVSLSVDPDRDDVERDDAVRPDVDRDEAERPEPDLDDLDPFSSLDELLREAERDDPLALLRPERAAAPVLPFE